MISFRSRLRFAVLVACSTMTSCMLMTSQTYNSVTSSGCSAGCVVDTPTVAISMVKGSRLPCAVKCLSNSCCLTYQMNDALGQCQLYNYIPANYSVSTQCQAYRVSKPDSALAVGTYTSCSFPFTLAGQLYYKCAVNHSMTPCAVLCVNTNAVTVTCPTVTYGFVAQNVTVNVTIPSINTPVSLRSVNGWLTIYSRVSSGFLTGQTYATYQAGFGSIASNFWLGLEKVYRLTNIAANGGHSYRLRVELLAINDNRWYSEEYASFYLGSSATTYVLHVSTTGTGDAGDPLNDSYSPANGYYFMTSGICVSGFGAFWYTTAGHCCFCRLFGAAAPGGGFTWTPIGDAAIGRLMVKQVG